MKLYTEEYFVLYEPQHANKIIGEIAQSSELMSKSDLEVIEEDDKENVYKVTITVSKL